MSIFIIPQTGVRVAFSSEGVHKSRLRSPSTSTSLFNFKSQTRKQERLHIGLQTHLIRGQTIICGRTILKMAYIIPSFKADNQLRRGRERLLPTNSSISSTQDHKNVDRHVLLILSIAWMTMLSFIWHHMVHASQTDNFGIARLCMLKGMGKDS